MAGIYEPKGRALEYSMLAVNHYTGCPHRCLYCYGPRTLKVSKEEFHSHVEPRKDILKIVGKQAARLAGTDKRVMLSFACDPYPDVDARLQLTRDVLKILRKNDVPFQVLTKAGHLAFRDFDLYRRGLDAFAVTLTTLDAEVASQTEPGAAPPAERIEMLQAAHDRGIETWVSLEPVLDPVESYKVLVATHEFVDLYKIGALNHVEHDITSDQWRDFGVRAINYCIATGTKYYIKQDLAGHLGEFAFGNTDNRKVQR